MAFIGRFHPLLVHFPIAILLLAFLFDLLSQKKRFWGLKSSIIPMLAIGTISAFLSVGTGYILSMEGGYEEKTLFYHQWAGIFTAVFSLLLWIVKLKLQSSQIIPLILFVTISIGITITGHLGANMTHGEDFLTEYAPWNSNKADKAFNLPKIENIEEAILYKDIIHPILESKCLSCHSSKKQKGDLRMDTKELLLKGGKNGTIILAGNADSSEIFKRLMLPIEDKHHMPPREKEQLSSAEIGLIQAWLTDGADFDKKINLMANKSKVKAYWQTLESMFHYDDWMPKEKVEPANPKDIEKLSKKGILIIPFAHDNNYLIVSFLNVDTTADIHLNNLLVLKTILRLGYKI